MYYEVYADSLFLVNFCMNLLCLELADLIFLKAASRRRLLTGAFVGAAMCLVPFLLPGPVFLRLAVGFLASALGMILTAFRVRTLPAFWNVLQKLLLCSFLPGGALLFAARLLPGAGPYLLSVPGLCAAALLLYKEVSRLVGKGGGKEDFCSVVLTGTGPPVEVRALVDTGNGLFEPISGKPVCILERSVFDRLMGGVMPEGFRAIPYHSVGKARGILRGYLIPEMRIERDGIVRKRRDVYVGLCEGTLAGEGGYEMLLHPAVLKEESENGKEII